MEPPFMVEPESDPLRVDFTMRAPRDRFDLVSLLAAQLAGLCHGMGDANAYNAVGYPIQSACFETACAAIDRLESYGWGPYPYQSGGQ